MNASRYRAALLVLVAGCVPVYGADPAEPTTRGQMLYENHCTGCHTSVVHAQEAPRATSDVAVEGWVRKWSIELKLDWTDAEILDVTDFLLHRYYRFWKPGEPAPRQEQP